MSAQMDSNHRPFLSNALSTELQAALKILHPNYSGNNCIQSFLELHCHITFTKPFNCCNSLQLLFFLVCHHRIIDLFQLENFWNHREIFWTHRWIRTTNLSTSMERSDQLSYVSLFMSYESLALLPTLQVSTSNDYYLS